MARGYTQRIKKCQLKSDRFNYKRDIVGIISVTRVSRPHNTRFTKKIDIKQKRQSQTRYKKINSSVKNRSTPSLEI